MILPNLDELFACGLALGQSRQAMVGPTGACTYGDLVERVSDYEKALAARGFFAGHRIAIRMAPTVGHVALLIAGLRLGMWVGLLPASLGQRLFQRRLDELGADAVVEGSTCVADLPRPHMPSLDGRAAVVMWTSGSAGTPKGVAFTPGALLWNSQASATQVGFRSEDRTLVLLDAGYSYALVHQILGHLIVGGTVIAPDRGEWLPSALREIVRRQITTLVLVPTLLKAILSLPNAPDLLRRLRVLTVGGAPVPESLLGNLHALAPHLEIYITYGLTEAGPRVSTRRFDGSSSPMSGGVGKPLPGVNVVVGAQGQLLVRSPSSRFAMLAEGKFVPAPDWITTGDVGNITGDGAIVLTGRITQFINRSGMKLLPGDIERVLCSHPRIRSALVICASHSRLGEVPVAYAVPAGEKPSVSELADHCRRWLGEPWVPAQIHLVSHLPARQGSSWKTLEDGPSL